LNGEHSPQHLKELIVVGLILRESRFNTSLE